MLIFKFIEKLFSKNKVEGIKYTIDTKEIIISQDFKEKRVRGIKLSKKFAFFDKYGRFESKIILDENYVLLDGYTSWIIAQTYKIKRVPVFFCTNSNT